MVFACCIRALGAVFVWIAIKPSHISRENFFGFFDFIEKFPTDYDILNGV
jgi:hypothetical protein